MVVPGKGGVTSTSENSFINHLVLFFLKSPSNENLFFEFLNCGIFLLKDKNVIRNNFVFASPNISAFKSLSSNCQRKTLFKIPETCLHHDN